MKRSKSVEIILEMLGLVFVVIIAAYLRLYQNNLTPGWYNDEGTLVNIAKNLMQGRLEYLGIQDSILIAGRPPLFVLLLSWIFHFFPPGIDTLRSFTGILGTLSAGMMYFVFRRHGRALAMLIAFSYAVFPKAVLYSRMGFSYNLIVPLVILSFWAGEQYLDSGKRGYAAMMALLMGLGFASDLVAFAFFPTVLLIVLWKRWKDLLFVAPLLALPFAVHALVMLLIAPEAFLYDFGYTFLRVSHDPLPVQFLLILISTGFVLQDALFLFGLAGIFLTPDIRWKYLLLAFTLIPLIVTTRSVGIGTLGWYYLIPFYPFFAVGVGIVQYRILQEAFRLVRQLFDAVYLRIQNKHLRRTKGLLLAFSQVYIAFLVFIAPMSLGIWISGKQINDRNFTTTLDFVLIDINEGNQAVDFINHQVSPGDLVIASPAVAWAIKGNVTDYQIAIASSGKNTIHFQTGIPASRFRFPTDLSGAKYVIVDNIWRNWGIRNLPDLDDFTHSIRPESEIYRSENITIYKMDE